MIPENRSSNLISYINDKIQGNATKTIENKIKWKKFMWNISHSLDLLTVEDFIPNKHRKCEQNFSEIADMISYLQFSIFSEFTKKKTITVVGRIVF